MHRYRALIAWSLFAASVALVGVIAWGGREVDKASGEAWLCLGGFFGSTASETTAASAAAPLEAGLAPMPESGVAVVSSAMSALSFLTGGGSYVPRTHCMVNEAGETDWPWVIVLLVLNATVIAGYARIFVFWRRAYLYEEPQDRNKKLMDLAWIFLWCAVCGYAASVLVFVWPAYRLVAFALVPLAFFTWKFASNQHEMRVSLSAKRLARELEEVLRARNEKLEREVEARTAELEQARDAERAASEAKSAFIATVSHEIRTPLNAIMGYSAMLAEGRMSDEVRAEYAETIRRNGDHLATVIDDVLDISKIESRNLRIDSTPCDPIVITTDVVTLLTPRAAERGNTISCELDGKVPSRILGDPTRIRQVLLNLAGNAVKFTESGSIRIVLSAERPHVGTVLKFRVIDTGIGMTRDQMGKVFEPFRQAEPGTTRRFGGTGLGLSISRSLAELMGGAIEVESVLGKGSVFTATMRVGVPAEAAWVETVEKAPRKHVPREDGAELTGKVLVADDSVDNRRLFIMLLEKLGLETVAACDGEEAVEACLIADQNGEPFDVIFMDIDMPRCDGTTAMRRIRARSPRQTIIALTAHSMSGVRAKLLAEGFDDYASKPIGRELLMKLCERWISESRDAA